MKPKSSLIAAAVMLALALPVTSGAFVALSASPVLAKGGNGKGGSDRGKSTRPDRGKGGQSDRGRGGSNAGNGGTGNAYGKSGGNGNGNGNGRNASASGTGQTAAVTDATALDMHPSAQGSMNGALNANINAVLAHIRNGNTNGPVGALAGLAVADHNAAGAQDVLDQAAEVDALQSTLETALADAGFATIEDYQAALGSGASEAIGAIEDAQDALGAAAGAALSEEDIAAAEAAVDALALAEAGILDAWNKSGSATEAEKDALMDAAAYESFVAEDAAE